MSTERTRAGCNYFSDFATSASLLVARCHDRRPGPIPKSHRTIPLLALNGLRLSEALGADIEALGLERGHRTLTVLRKVARS
jgi:hypothetical protein